MVNVSAFDDLIVSRSLLTHYFYAKKWNEGELTQDDMRVYAKEYYHLVRNVPTILERVRERAVRRGLDVTDIDRNIDEEREHVELWERFASELGLTPEEVRSHRPNPKISQAVDALKDIAEGEFEDGVALMYSLELDLPAIAESKKKGLDEYYGLTTENAHVYFDEHLHEEEHLKVWRKYRVNDERASKVIVSSLALQHEVLDGVCDACGIVMECD